ncbi:major facilitator superfamily domain-containing protein 4A-like [Gigantopelta aegis]|uniref:major facilitator superfamily domain-containing protein 4A-like n=1 Tax=Gigantopelta aegis TaxID=1735272 RepID=UPI001B88C29C|nr:major facilitator superfamily domain-containing protein 4A-like [Gigantopelta aegis]
MGDSYHEPTADETSPKEDPNSTQITQGHAKEKVNFWKLFKGNWIKVVTHCAVFGSFGVCVGFLGPTVFDLGCQTNSDLKKMSWVFFVQLLMTLVGSITAGCLADKVPTNILLLIGSVGVSFSMVLIPSCTTLGGLIVVLMIMGWCMGCIDCIANLKMIILFKKNVAPFLQAMHCCYGFGAFVSPMIASAFLLNMDCTPFVDGYTVAPEPIVSHDKNVTFQVPPQPHIVFRYRNMSHIPTAFYILGGLQFIIAALVALVVIRDRLRGEVDQPSETYHTATKSISEDGWLQWVKDQCCVFGPREVIVIVALAAMSIFFYDGLQSSYANYIYTYAHQSDVANIEKYEGAILDACFWGMFALGRLLAVPAATKFTAACMLLVNIIGCSFAIIITLIFRFSHVAIYLGTCLVGIFTSSMSPTCISMTEQYVDINSSITTVLVVFAALGEALCPIIVGNLVVTVGATSFLAFCFTIVLLSLLLYWALFAAGKQMPKFSASRPGSFVWLSRKYSAAGESTVIDPSSVKYYTRMPESLSSGNVEMAALDDPPQTRWEIGSPTK